VHHPLGCHRSRIPDRVVFNKLVQVLVFGCAYRRIADDSCSATTLRDRRDEWIACGVIEKLRQIALDAYDRMIGLQLAEVAVDGCIAKAPCGGEKAGKSPVDRGKQQRRANRRHYRPDNDGWWKDQFLAQNAHKKLAWCTERVGRVIDFWVAFSEVIIIVRRLIREGWMRYRWGSRPPRQP
jgi:transposase